MHDSGYGDKKKRDDNSDFQKPLKEFFLIRVQPEMRKFIQVQGTRKAAHIERRFKRKHGFHKKNLFHTFDAIGSILYPDRL